MRLRIGFESAMFSVKAVSERFKIPKGTIYDYIRKGKIKVIRNPLSNGLLIPEEEVSKLQAVGEFYQKKNAGKGVI